MLSHDLVFLHMVSYTIYNLLKFTDKVTQLSRIPLARDNKGMDKDWLSLDI